MINSRKSAADSPNPGFSRSRDAVRATQARQAKRATAASANSDSNPDGSANSTADGQPAAKRAGFGLSLKGRALRLLAQREHSRAELEKKLHPHEETPGQLTAMLDELQAKDFISEARVVESVINRRSGKFGAARIKYELLNKGLETGRVQDAVQRLKATDLERARDIWRRKFDATGDGAATDAASRARQMRFLAARGFGGDVIGKVVRGGGRADADE